MCAHGRTKGDRTTMLQILQTNCAYSPRAPPTSWVTSCSGKTLTPPSSLLGPAGVRDEQDGDGRDAMPSGGDSTARRGGPFGASPALRELAAPADAGVSGPDGVEGPLARSAAAAEPRVCCGLAGLAASCRSATAATAAAAGDGTEAVAAAAPLGRGCSGEAGGSGALGCAAVVRWPDPGSPSLLVRPQAARLLPTASAPRSLPTPPLLLARPPELPLLPLLPTVPGGSPSRPGNSRRLSAQPAS
mmetsp:Transcript_36046/g.99989  ORF Transcript_36046/g.99989 Transcript_36046/m.99989 type:complete len:245 (+) Transcript_36046:1163-1897(+)